MKKGTSIVVLWLLSLFFSGHVVALTIVDVDPNDDNLIINSGSTPGELTVEEIYFESFRTPYPSHDGFAIVNASGGFFDKVITIESGDSGIWTFNFLVTNGGPYLWSDYHFEFYNADFSFPIGIPLGDPQWLLAWDNDIFQNSSVEAGGIPDRTSLNFWAPGWQANPEQNHFILELDLDRISDILQADSFGIQQIATTAPEVGSLILVGSGLLGLMGLKRK